MSVGKSYKEYQKCIFNKIWEKSRNSHASVFCGQKGQGPLEKPQEIPHCMFCPRQKKLISRTFKIRGTLVFLCPKERDRERARERERESKREQERESERK
jgi:hypothetical protein